MNEFRASSSGIVTITALVQDLPKATSIALRVPVQIVPNVPFPACFILDPQFHLPANETIKRLALRGKTEEEKWIELDLQNRASIRFIRSHEDMGFYLEHPENYREAKKGDDDDDDLLTLYMDSLLPDEMRESKRRWRDSIPVLQLAIWY